MNRILVIVSIAIVMLLLAIIVPAYLSWQICECASACYRNLHAIDNAKRLYAVSNNLPDGAVVQKLDILPLVEGGWPKCPRGGRYIINPIGQNPKCTYSGKPGGKVGDNHSLIELH